MLFDRTCTACVRLPQACFIDAAQAIEERLRILERRDRRHQGRAQRQPRLGVVSTAKYFAPRLIAGFKREIPTSTCGSSSATARRSIASLKEIIRSTSR